MENLVSKEILQCGRQKLEIAYVKTAMNSAWLRQENGVRIKKGIFNVAEGLSIARSSGMTRLRLEITVDSVLLKTLLHSKN